MKRFAYQKVIDHFNKTGEYKIRKGIVHIKEDPIIINFIRSHALIDHKILEVGGGSGAFLDQVIENTVIKDAYNIELVYKTYKSQGNELISLIGGNALNLPFEDYSFDWVVTKNLLHHLVGKTRKESKQFAKRAVEELIRVTKEEGYIIILDQYNRHKSFSSIIFYLTLFFSIFSISLESFGLGENVIVSFLHPDETMHLLMENGNIELIFNKENKIDVSKKLKYSLLMADIGRLLVIGKVRKNVKI